MCVNTKCRVLIISYTLAFASSLTNSIVCGACCQAFVNRLYQFAFHLGQQWAVHTNTPPHLKKKVQDYFKTDYFNNFNS